MIEILGTIVGEYVSKEGVKLLIEAGITVFEIAIILMEELEN